MNPIRLFAFTSIILFAVFSVRSEAKKEVTPYFQTRLQGATHQSHPNSCGPAVVSGYLRVFMDVDVTEKDIIGHLESRFSIVFNEKPEGVSLQSLKVVLQENYRLDSVVMKVKPDDLKEYFQEGGLPLIAQIQEPLFHFVIFAGFVDAHHLLVIDPFEGQKIVTMDAFLTKRSYQGYLLAFNPDPQQLKQIRGNQTLKLSQGLMRLERLRELARGPK